MEDTEQMCLDLMIKNNNSFYLYFSLMMTIFYMFARHSDIWLLIGNCRYLYRLASQSKVRSLSYIAIPFEVTHANIFSPMYSDPNVTIQLDVSLISACLIYIIKPCNYILLSASYWLLHLRLQLWQCCQYPGRQFRTKLMQKASHLPHIVIQELCHITIDGVDLGWILVVKECTYIVKDHRWISHVVEIFS